MQLAAMVRLSIVSMLLSGVLRNCKCDEPSERGNHDVQQFEPKSFEGIELFLRIANEGSLAPRLPVLLEVTIVNGSNRVVFPEPTLPRLYEPNHIVEIWYAHGDDNLAPVERVLPEFGVTDGTFPMRRPKLARLGSGMFWLMQVPASYKWGDRESTPLIVPGKLRFQVRYFAVKRDAEGELVTDRGLFVESNMVHIRISEPRDNEAAALEVVETLKSPAVLCRPHLMRTGTESDIEALENIVTQFPTSAYAVYAKFAMANALIWSSSVQLEFPESPELERGIQLVNDVLQDSRFVFTEQARELLWQAKIHQAKLSPAAFSFDKEFSAAPPTRLEGGGYR